MTFTSPVHGQSAAHADDLAGNVVRRWRSEEHDGMRDFPGLRRTTQGYRLDERPAQFFVHGLRKQRCVGRPGSDAIASDAIARRLPCQSLGECDHGALAAGVESFAGAADAARVTGYGDDLCWLAALNDNGQQSLDHAHWSDVIDRDDLVP